MSSESLFNRLIPKKMDLNYIRCIQYIAIRYPAETAFVIFCRIYNKLFIKGLGGLLYA